MRLRARNWLLTVCGCALDIAARRMSGALDLSLDDIISANKPKKGRGAGRGAGREGGRGAKAGRGIAVRGKATVGKARNARNAGPSVRAVHCAVAAPLHSLATLCGGAGRHAELAMQP